MPAYNEEACIEEVVLGWKNVLPDSGGKIVVADSGSTDHTHGILEKLHNQYPQMIEILSDTEKYHGSKLIALYKYAIEQGSDYIFQTDSDGQTSPDEFKNFWDERDEFDAVLGKRSVRGDGKQRKFVENVLCII